jgi:hypothetical protein
MYPLVAGSSLSLSLQTASERQTDAVPIFSRRIRKKNVSVCCYPGERIDQSFTAGATATSPQLVGFAPRLLHNVAGLIGLYESRAVALGWENCG